MTSNKKDSVISELNIFLANTFTLYLKTHKFHWNVEGSDFYELHTFFEKLYEDMWEAVDAIAEHIRALGEYAPGSYEEFSRLTQLKAGGTKVKSMDMIQEMLKDHERLMKQGQKLIEIADAAGDTVTADFVTARLDAHQKHAWMLRSFLK